MSDPKCQWQPPEDWSQWSQWLAAGLHARNRWRLPVLLVGILFARGRRTVTTWLRAAGVSADYQDYYYFLAALGRKTKTVATQLLALILRTLPLDDRLLVVIDDTPTKRYGPKVEGADIHHNPTPGPADQKYLYGHIWVTLSLAVRHPRFGALALPLWAMLYVRRQMFVLASHVIGGSAFGAVPLANGPRQCGQLSAGSSAVAEDVEIPTKMHRTNKVLMTLVGMENSRLRKR